MATTIIIAVLIFIIAAVIYVFLIMPRVADAADMELLACDYAHRGLWDDKIPENSLPAFELAAREGYGIELDIRLCADGRIMVFHDASLRRMCGSDRRFGELTYAQLRTLSLAGTKEKIPTLGEVLALVAGRVPLLIEVKSENGDIALCKKAAKLLDDYPGPFCVESFDPLVLRWFKNYRPRYARGQLVARGRTKGDLPLRDRLLRLALSSMLFNVLSRPDFIAVDKGCQGNISFKICTALFRAKAFVWTVRTPDEYRVVKSGGKHAIFENIRPR